MQSYLHATRRQYLLLGKYNGISMKKDDITLVKGKYSGIIVKEDGIRSCKFRVKIKICSSIKLIEITNQNNFIF